MVARPHVRSVGGEAAREHKKYAQGIPAAMGCDALGRVGARKAQGLGVLYGTEHVWTGLHKHWTPGNPHLGRLHSGWVVMESFGAIVHNVYLCPESDEDTRRVNETVLSTLVARVKEAGSEFQIILGGLSECSGRCDGPQTADRKWLALL